MIFSYKNYWGSLRRDSHILIDLLTSQTLRGDWVVLRVKWEPLYWDIWGFVSSISVLTVPLGGAVYTLHTLLWQCRSVSLCTSPVLMALLMCATVQGDREQWFWGLVGTQKVEQLNAALSLPLWLLHIQKVTQFFSPSPLPDTGPWFLKGGVGFLGEEMVTIT